MIDKLPPRHISLKTALTPAPSPVGRGGARQRRGKGKGFHSPLTRSALRLALFGLLLAMLWQPIALTHAQTPDAEVNFYPIDTPDGSPFTVGDPITLRLEVKHPADSTVDLPQIDKEWGDFEVISQTGQDTVPHNDGTSTTRKDIVVTLFAPGQYQTPPLVVTHHQADGASEDLGAPVIPIKVSSVLVDGDEELRALKAQAELPVPPLWPFVLVGLLLSAVIAGAMYWAGLWAYNRWIRKTPVTMAPQPFIDPRPPEVIALTELARIESLNLPALAQLKEHYSLVTDCLRQYIEGRYQIPALEQTTDELQSSLRRQATVPGDARDSFVRLFRRSDLVKFARFRPAPDDAYRFLSEARIMVEVTTPIPEPAAPAAQEVKADV